jgi:hypothetical protein
MRNKTLVILALFTLLAVSVASAKTYSITLYNPSQFGSTTLQPGDYKLKLDGTKAIVVDRLGKTAAEANVRVETANKKFDRTELTLNTAGGTSKVTEVALGGSKTRLVIE